MNNLSVCLNKSAPAELFNIVSECYSEENLVKQLANDPSRLFSFLQNVREGYEPIAAKALVKVHPKDLENADLKKVETVLRNKGLLSRVTDPDISLKGKEWSKTIEGHKNILALEAPMFMEGRDFIDNQKRELELGDMGISEEAYHSLVDYLYLPDEQRKEFATHVDKSLLIQLAKLSDIMGIEDLRSHCDDELCNSIGVLGIQNQGLKGWMDQANPTPKFALLLEFIKKVADVDGSLGATIKQMGNLDHSAQLISKCTPQEIALFATLKTDFGIACQLKDTGAFGKAEWEKAFPV